MDARTAKRRVAAAGLDLYYSREWQSWGIIDPDGLVDGEWFSSADLRDMTEQQLAVQIGAVQGRKHPVIEGYSA